MEIQLEKMCRTCLAESKTLIPILAIDDTVSKDNDSSLEPPSLALILETLTKSDVSVICVFMKIPINISFLK